MFIVTLDPIIFQFGHLALRWYSLILLSATAVGVWLTAKEGALVFLAATSLRGSYPLVARVGDTVWIGLLGLIVSMPLVIFAVKKRHQIA